MEEKQKDYLNIFIFAVLIFGFFLFCLIRQPKQFSETERRLLQQPPALNVESIFAKKGQKSFMDDFESYAADQFPLRESFRRMYAVASYYGLQKQEVNEIYYVKDNILKLSLSEHKEDMEWSANRISYLHDKYLQNSRVYFAVIPDKNYYFADETEVPCLDYDAFYGHMCKRVAERATCIDLRKTLKKDSFYRTDTHWKQECLYAPAVRILESMGKEYPMSLADRSFEQTVFTDQFAGVYYGQGALPVPKDSLVYLTGDYISDLKVVCYDSGKEEILPLYDEDKALQTDAYELFLSGSRALLTVENPNAGTKDELIIFRDSFGSSIAPLLAGSYRKLTMIDIRYIRPDVLGRFIDFEDKDVLFLYSTQVLNNSIGQFLD